MKTMSIEILEKNNISYIIRRNKGKTYRLRFNNDGILLIYFPYFSRESGLISFIEKNIDWIINKKEITLSKIVSYENNTKHLYYGQECTLKVNFSKTNRIDKIDDIIIVSTSKLENVRKNMIKWRTEIAEIVFEQLLYKCFNHMQDVLKRFPVLTVKNSKTKWGCCYYNDNRIMLNVALTQVPFELIEYVIYHELTHFVINNHSKEFHKVLGQYCPNERKLSKELKKYNNRL